MNFAELLKIVGDEPVFESALLFAGASNVPYLQRQLSRWVRKGYLHQLRRELYAVAPPYQKTRPHPFLLANRMVRASYVSCESALAFHGLIPEFVPATTSVTTQRSARWSNVYGEFIFEHVKVPLFFGYERIQLSDSQHTFLATPAKALLDLIYLRANADLQNYLRELRLQHLDRLDLDRFDQYVIRANSPKLSRAARHVKTLVEAELNEYEVLR